MISITKIIKNFNQIVCYNTKKINKRKDYSNKKTKVNSF